MAKKITTAIEMPKERRFLQLETEGKNNAHSESRGRQLLWSLLAAIRCVR